MNRPALFLILLLALCLNRAAGQGMNPEQLYDAALGGIVRIFTHNSTGTGFLVNNQGYVVTNHHVISNKTNLRVKFANGKTYRVIRVVDHMDQRNEDLALLYIGPVEGHTPLPVLGSGEARVGVEIAVIGSPRGFEFTMITGVISRHETRSDRSWNLLHTAPTNPGNSGSALLNRYGQVVGVATSTYTHIDNRPVTGIHIATNATSLRRLLRRNRVEYTTGQLITDQQVINRENLSPAEQKALEEARLATIRQQRQLDSLRLQVEISKQKGQLQQQQEQLHTLHLKEMEYQKLQQEHQDKQRRMARRSMPGRMVFKAGGGAHYYMAHWENYDSNFDPSLPAIKASAMIAYRYNVTGAGSQARGNALALFASAGRMNGTALKTMDEQLRGGGHGPAHGRQYFTEMELGWMFRQWFRLSTGAGRQGGEFLNISDPVMDYYTTSTGLILRMGWIELDITATAFWGKAYQEPALRYNTSLNLYIPAGRW